MNCPWCERWLHESWEGMASPYPPPDLTQHWEASPACRQRAELASRCREVLPSKDATTPPVHFAEQVLSRFRKNRNRSQAWTWLTTVAFLLVAGSALTWTMLNESPHPDPVARQHLQPAAPPGGPELAQLRDIVEPLEEATDRTLHMTKQMADDASAKFRKLLPRFQPIELPPVQDAWTVSVLPVRVVGEAASAGFDPLATSTKEAYQTVKQYLPPLPKRKAMGSQMR